MAQGSQATAGTCTAKASRGRSIPGGSKPRRWRSPLGLATALAWLLAAAQPALAQTLVRDSEIERMVEDMSAPIFEAAGLDPEQVNVLLVQDDSINAFVAGGQNLFLHTGLIVRAAEPERLAATIAHEAGHIAGGHLSRVGQAQNQAIAEAMIGAALGAAAAVAGQPQLATAIIAGGATVAERNLLKYSRTQEQAADQAAVTYLARAGLPPEGLVEMFRILERHNLRINAEGDEFLRTHPLTRERIRSMEAATAQSPLKGQRYPEEVRESYHRAVAKLEGFLADPQRVLGERTGDGFLDRYARAVALYRSARSDEALDLLVEMRAQRPDDPWLAELHGQVLFETGRVAEAVEPYRRALDLAPGEPLLQLGLARALMERQGQGDLDEAVRLLEIATAEEPRNAGMWRFLGLALGRSGQEGRASLALAEHAVLTRERDDANLYLARAERMLEPGGAEWLHLQDLKRSAAELPVPPRAPRGSG